MCKRSFYSFVGIVLVFVIVFSTTLAFAAEAPIQGEKSVSKIVEKRTQTENYIEAENKIHTQEKGSNITCTISFQSIKAKIGSNVTVPRIAAAVLALLKSNGLDTVTTQSKLVSLLKKLCDSTKLISLVKAGSKNHGLKIFLTRNYAIIYENGIAIQKTKWAIKNISLY